MTRSIAPSPLRRPDPDDLRENRQAADLVQLHRACPASSCRRARRCQGRLRPFRDTGRLALPCTIMMREHIFGTAESWEALTTRLEDLQETLGQRLGPARGNRA